MHKYGLVGTLQAHAGHGAALSQILLQAATLMDQAPGCMLYVVSREAESPDTISIMEVWASKADHDTSLTLPGVRELIQQAMPLLDGPPTAGRTLDVLGGKGLPSER